MNNQWTHLTSVNKSSNLIAIFAKNLVKVMLHFLLLSTQKSSFKGYVTTFGYFKFMESDKFVSSGKVFTYKRLKLL